MILFAFQTILWYNMHAAKMPAASFEFSVLSFQFGVIAKAEDKGRRQKTGGNSVQRIAWSVWRVSKMAILVVNGGENCAYWTAFVKKQGHLRISSLVFRMS